MEGREVRGERVLFFLIFVVFDYFVGVFLIFFGMFVRDILGLFSGLGSFGLVGWSWLNIRYRRGSGGYSLFLCYLLFGDV